MARPPTMFIAVSSAVRICSTDVRSSLPTPAEEGIRCVDRMRMFNGSNAFNARVEVLRSA